MGLFLTLITYYLGAKAQVNAFPTYITGLACLPLYLYPRRAAELGRNPVLTLSIALGFYLALTTAWGPSPALKTTSLYVGFALLLLGYVIGIVFAQDTWPALTEWLVTLTILSATVSAAYSIYLFYGVDYHPRGVETDRIYALGRIPNAVVSAFSWCIPLVFATVRMLSRRAISERLLWAVTVLVLGYAVVKTGTRSVWIGLLAAALVGVDLIPALTLRRRVMLWVGVLILACASIVVILHSDMRAEFLRRSTSFRPTIWSSTLHKMVGKDWLIGHGNDAPSGVHDGRLVFDHPHSIYLSTLFYGGAIGILLLLALIVVALRSLIRSPPSDLRTTALMVLVFGLTSLIFDGDHLLEKIDYIWIVFWLPIAFAAIESRRVND